ncbi:peptidase M50B-like-domain-containing protein [Lophiotrema nucula]|uniref:Peptidase M50B-like-domain-containing protein n=1 Tax=Lophiotrema nucula TaxID=690887 RepID=A0A6A5YEF6_9PLEO|nr:peptidase M50B-like-domain-containing protein [Lophiotrema nucula]
MAPLLPEKHQLALAQLARRALVTVAPALAQPHLQRRGLSVNHTQGVTLGVIAAYVVVIALLWNLPYVRWVLWPFKMLVIAFHEFGHAITACCTGGRVKGISLDPHEGGVTFMQGGIQAVTLPAGYLGSSLIGALLTFCGFNIVASKIASIILGVCFLLTLWWARKDWLTIITIVLAVGLLVACWFIKHAEPLRFVVLQLFIGVMSSLYSVWDICDDLILRKVNSSDASVFAKRYGGSSQCWGIIWSLISLFLMICGILAGLAAFKQSFQQQEDDSKDVIPTELPVRLDGYSDTLYGRHGQAQFHIPHLRPGQGSNEQSYVRLLIFFKKRPDVTEQHFQEWWKSVHADLGLSAAGFNVHVSRYVQFYQTSQDKERLKSLGMPILDFDDMGEMHCEEPG